MIKSLLLDLIFPKRCAICDRVLPLGEQEICEPCKKKLHYITEDTCCKCGKPVKAEEEYCYDCKHKNHLFCQGAALFPYDYIRGSLYRYKYAGRQEYAVFYGRHMGRFFQEKKELWRPDALIPVPLHKKKLRKRGYNQAELLADQLSRIWKIPVINNLVIRTKNTKPMKEIDGTERQNNLKKAFKIDKNDVKLNTIIIVDDIYTTGSTMDAISQVCLEAGIQNIYFLSISVGHGL